MRCALCCVFGVVMRAMPCAAICRVRCSATPVMLKCPMFAFTYCCDNTMFGHRDVHAALFNGLHDLIHLQPPQLCIAAFLHLLLSQCHNHYYCRHHHHYHHHHHHHHDPTSCNAPPPASFHSLMFSVRCMADEIINAAKGSSNSYAIKKKVKPLHLFHYLQHTPPHPQPISCRPSSPSQLMLPPLTPG